MEGTSLTKRWKIKIHKWQSESKEQWKKIIMCNKTQTKTCDQNFWNGVPLSLLDFATTSLCSWDSVQKLKGIWKKRGKKWLSLSLIKPSKDDDCPVYLSALIRSFCSISSHLWPLFWPNFAFFLFWILF